MSFKRKTLEISILYGSLLFPLSVLFNILAREIYLVFFFLLIPSLLFEKKNWHPPRFLINLLGLSFILIFFLTVSLTNFLEKALETLFLLLSLKFLENKTLRDYLQIYLLEFLILCGASFYYAELSFFLILALSFIYFGYALFLHLYMEEGEVSILTGEEIKAIIFSFGALLFLSFILSIVFFLGLPRLQVPLFTLGIEKERAKTGFTDKIRLGSFSEIQESSAPVLRIIFEKNYKPDPKELYFKVIAFDYFDGRTWKRTVSKEEENPLRAQKGPAKKATFYLLSGQQDYLPFLERKLYIKASFTLRHYQDGIVKSAEPLNYPVKYELYFTETGSEVIYEKESEAFLVQYLQVPEVSENIKKLAEKLKGKNDRETLENILNYFKKEGFQYSLSSLPLGEKALENFLFKVKRGNCEYFAGTTALLLRLNGIPSRVIGGYRGAVYNPQGGYYLVEERFAHSWVEAYLQGSWVRIDPTPGFSYEMLIRKKGILETLRLYYDLLNHYYTKLILDYNYQKQKKFYEILREKLTLKEEKPFRDFNFKSGLKEKKLLAIAFLILLGLFFFLKYGRTLFEPKEKRLLRAFFKELKKRGYVKRENEGIFELIEKLRDEALKNRALKFAKIYSEYYYKDKPFDKMVISELKRCLKELRNLS